jgi:hypothetical protein
MREFMAEQLRNAIGRPPAGIGETTQENLFEGEQYSPNPSVPDRRFGPFNNLDMSYAPLAAGVGAAAGAAGTPQRPDPLGLPYSETPIAGDGSQYVSSPTFAETPPANLFSDSDRRRGRDDTFVFGDDMRTPIPSKRPRQEEPIGDISLGDVFDNVPVSLNRMDDAEFFASLPEGMSQREKTEAYMEYEYNNLYGDKPPAVEAPAVDGAPDTTIVAGDVVPASNPVKLQEAQKPDPWTSPDPFEYSFVQLTTPGGALNSLYETGIKVGLSSYGNYQSQLAAQRQLDYERSLALPPPDPTLALPPPDPTLALPAPSETLALTMPGYGMEAPSKPPPAFPLSYGADGMDDFFTRETSPNFPQDVVPPTYNEPAGPEPRLSDRLGLDRLGFNMNPTRYLTGKPGDTDIVRPRDNPTTVPLMGDAPLDTGPTNNLQNNNWFWNRGYGENDMLEYGDPLESIPY